MSDCYHFIEYTFSMVNHLPLRASDYGQSFNKYGESPKSLKWASYKAAAQRYRELVADLNIKDKSILDAGCGMGDLLPYLYAKSPNFKYFGMDNVPGFIDIAAKRYEGSVFEVGDFMDKNFEQQFDIVISSGAMNSNVPDWLNLRKTTISKLFRLANEAAAFNMAGGFMEPAEVKNIAYANALDILEFCRGLTPKIIFRGHYHSKDFSLILFK